MSEHCVKETIKEKSSIVNSNNNNNHHLRHCDGADDVVQRKDACALPPPLPPPAITSKLDESEIPTKKRKTRRGKSKRRHPYNRKIGSNHHNNNNNNGNRKLNKLMNKPEAPYNNNQFLLEDHGDIENLDENLKYAEQRSTTSGGRTRDSSISIDTDGEFYSSPDDEEQFLIKDFVDQYESVQAERLQSMTKDELIREYLALESKVEYLTKRLRKKEKPQQQQQQCDDSNDNNNCELELEKEIDRLTNENDALKRELAVLRRDIDNNCNANNKNNCTTSDTEDSETDSDDSCSSTSTSSSSSSNCSKPTSPVIDYTQQQTNGHSASVETV